MWCMERGRVIVRPSKHSDATAIKDRLRQSDVDEIWASTHQTPEEAILYSRRISSSSHAVLLDGKTVALFGVSPAADRKGVAGVWFVSTDDIAKMWVSFLRMSRECVRRMLDEYPYLFNWVDDRNELSIKWLRWCGAKIEDPQPFGPDGAPFRFFVIKRR